MMRRQLRDNGFTIIETMVASVIASVVAGGTMMAFVTAARINRMQNAPALVEATLLAEQTLERHRNDVFPNSPFLALGDSPTTWNTWNPENPPGAGTGAGGTESILYMNNYPARRCFQVHQEDCDNDGTAGDCYAVRVQVCWNNLTGCLCPYP